MNTRILTSILLILALAIPATIIIAQDSGQPADPVAPVADGDDECTDCDDGGGCSDCEEAAPAAAQADECGDCSGEDCSDCEDNASACNAGRRHLILKVDGMHCGNCAKHVVAALETFACVVNTTVNLEAKEAVVVFDASKCAEEARGECGDCDDCEDGACSDCGSRFAAAVTEAGYKAAVLPIAAHVVDVTESTDTEALINALREVDGVRFVKQCGGKIVVVFETDKVNVAQLDAAVAAVTAASEEASTDEAENTSTPAVRVLTVKIGGMHCGGCAGKLERKLKTVAGVVAVTVTFDNATASITWSGETNVSDVTDAVKTAIIGEGYTVANVN